MGEAILRFLTESLKRISNVTYRTFGGILEGAMSLVGSAFKGVLSYHQEGISFARQMGMSFKQSQAYTNVLINRASELGQKYGIAADKVFELQRNISAATGRQMMLNNAQAEAQVRINKLVDTATSNRFTEEIITHMGGQIQSVQKAIERSYATAAKSGLDAAKFSERVAQNLQLANKLSFKNGIEGITRMTILSERLGFNLQSVEAAANNFMELDKAIENAAHLQMLGGAASAFGSNPLTMSYEANYDPEAFMTRITNMLQGLATFNTKTGMADVNGMNKDFVKAIAQAAGMSYEEAMSIAKNQATVQYKENQFGAVLQNPRYTEEMRNFILNTSYIQDGKLMMTDSLGIGREISQFSEKELMEKMGLSKMSDSELIASQAQTLTSIQELAEGTWTSMNANMARGVNEQIPAIMGIMRQMAEPLVNFSKEMGSALGGVLKVGMEALPSILKVLKPIGNAVLSLVKLAGEWPKTTFYILAGVQAIRMLLAANRGGEGIIDRFRNRRRGRGVHTRRFFRRNPTPNASPRRFQLGERVRNTFNGARNRIGQVGTKIGDKLRAFRKDALNSAKNAWTTMRTPEIGIRGARLSRVARTALKGGLGGIAVGLGGMATDALLNSGVVDKNSVGGQLLSGASTLLNSNTAQMGAMGSIFGPIGAGIGALVGVGLDVKNDYEKWKQKNPEGSFWEYSKEKVGKVMSTFTAFGSEMKKGFSNVTQAYKDAGGGIKGVANAAWSAIKEFNPFAVAHKGVVSLLGSKKTKGHASGGIVGGDSFNGDKVLTRVNSGEMILNHAQQTALFNLLNGKADPNLNTNVGVVKSSVNNIMFTNRDRTQSRIGIGREMDIALRPLSVTRDIDNTRGTIGAYAFNRARQTTTVKTQPLRFSLDAVDGGVHSTLTSRNDVQAKPVGEKEYIYIPPQASRYNGNASAVTVKDFNINISGTIKLDAGNSQKSVSTQELLNDRQFVNSLKELIKQSINNDINGGRFMNDVAQMRGLPAQTALWGRK